jgi:hypothetical protein
MYKLLRLFKHNSAVQTSIGRESARNGEKRLLKKKVDEIHLGIHEVERILIVVKVHVTPPN